MRSFALALALAVLALGAPAAAESPKADAVGSGAPRFEIIAVGAYPIALFAANLGFDIAAYLGSGLDSLYAPWPFRNDRRPALELGQQLWRLGVAALLSIGVASLDARRLPRARERRIKAAGSMEQPLSLIVDDEVIQGPSAAWLSFSELDRVSTGH